MAVKTLILYDRESTCYDNRDLCAQIRDIVRESGGEATVVRLNGDEIKPCRGCYRCWVKTPGQCILTDDCVGTVSGQEIKSDVVILLSRITYGGYSYDIKSFLDRNIPNILPFFEIVNGEMHHEMRYEHFPYMISIGYGDFTPQERQTFVSLAERNALNMRPPKHFAFAMRDAAEMRETMQALKTILSKEVCQ